MVGNPFSRFVRKEVDKRWSFVRTAAGITVRPTALADQRVGGEPAGLWPAFRFFLTAVGIVLAIEGMFSFMFRTAFSDLVHHFFPVLVVLTGGVAVYLLLKLLLTGTATFAGTVAATLYVGGAALFVMITIIFGLLTADFAMNSESVKNSGCTHRTIMCLLSGNIQYDYDIVETTQRVETQGWSYAPILIVILACLFYYMHIYSTIMKRSLDVARWRTYLASIVTVLVLSPAYLVLLNAIYRMLYGTL